MHVRAHTNTASSSLSKCKHKSPPKPVNTLLLFIAKCGEVKPHRLFTCWSLSCSHTEPIRRVLYPPTLMLREYNLLIYCQAEIHTVQSGGSVRNSAAGRTAGRAQIDQQMMMWTEENTGSTLCISKQGASHKSAARRWARWRPAAGW